MCSLLCVFRDEMSVQIICLPFYWVICFLIIKFWEFFMYSGNKSFVGYVVCNYFLPVWVWPFWSLNSVFRRADVWILMKSSLLIFSFTDSISGIISRIYLSTQCICVYSCMCVWMCVCVLACRYRHTFVEVPLIEKLILSSLNCLHTFITEQSV